MVKNKKNIFEAIAILLVISIITTNVQAITEKNPIEHKDNVKPQYYYQIFGIGYISYMTIDEKEDKYGILKGDLYIENEPGWSANINYKLFVFDKNNNTLLTKKTLPGEFTLQNFVGFGLIDFEDMPHYHVATKYFIIGKAVDLVV